ncbi:hypothetical protein DRF68_09120 [Candidatus Chryseobacterium massiliae]|uniref:Uncharacterized protein n=1 Tax=Candidatus Chryseobacterium massiliense TaxID=204089 RepID=A0A3D9BAK3_9FLAO|nr:hypothetical protein DRF68_09120 [Candidatus Chryseobacterium massiliae]
MQITIQAGTRKTAINSPKAIRKNNDESLKSFCGGSGISDHGYPKRFFSAETTEYFCYRKSGSLIRNDGSLKYDMLMNESNK